MADVTLALTGAEIAAAQGSLSASKTKALSGNAVATGRGTIKYNTVGLLSGSTFSTLPTLTGAAVNSGLIGATFETAPELFQAAVGTGAGFNSSVTLTATARNESFLEGGGFNTELSAVWIDSSNSSAIGQGFSTSPVLNGAGIASGRGFGTYPVLSGTAPTFASLTGGGFATRFEAISEAPASGRLVGIGFNTQLGGSGLLIGAGFNTAPLISLLDATAFAGAIVMNADTGQVTRYTNFPFNNIIVVAGKYYGVKTDGLYLLEGQDDNGTLINGSITTKDDDFGDMFSKNVPFAYLGCDDVDISVTPIVDDYEYPTYKESFDGRKVKMARGIKGRYWRLRIDNIKRLQSIETLQESMGRRVK